MELAEFSNEALMDIRVRPLERSEEGCYQERMARQHYLGALAVGGPTEPIGGGAEMRRSRSGVRDQFGRAGTLAHNMAG